MEYLKIKRPDGSIETVGYNYENFTFTFEQDIKVGDWTVEKIIIIRGSRWSNSIYDYSRYLEFLITDSNGKSEIKTYYYNENNDPELRDNYNSEHPISYFIECHPIFKCKNWEDYSASKVIKQVIEILENSASDNIEKQKQIATLFK